MLAYKLRYWGLRLSEKHHEREFGIHTDGRLTPAELGFTTPDLIEYARAPYHAFRKIFEILRIESKRPRIDLRRGLPIFGMRSA
jgi:hypothetical protein